ncbi:LINE-1 retrotransposable element ORF1 protein [Plecturocebus cupreus]
MIFIGKFEIIPKLPEKILRSIIFDISGADDTPVTLSTTQPTYALAPPKERIPPATHAKHSSSQHQLPAIKISTSPLPVAGLTRPSSKHTSQSRSRAWSGPQQSYSREARLLEGKLRNRNNFIVNKLDIHSEAQSESQQLQRRQEDTYTKMGRNQRKKDENTRNQNTSPPTRDHNSSPAREQGWMETECDEMTESGFRRWVIRNFCELKEHVLTQCKETKNLEKRFEEMLTRMDNLERTISELMELKNTTRELREACTSFNSRIDQAEERISEVEEQINEIKRECKIREKKSKGK